jgi:hypothetical protein
MNLKEVNRSHDSRGVITIFDLRTDIPFVPKRIFTLTEVPVGTNRGEHGHKSCEQYLVALTGSWRLNLVTCKDEVIHEISSESNGIYIPVNTFLTLSPIAENSSLCVFASHEYDPDDYFYEKPRRKV